MPGLNFASVAFLARKFSAKLSVICGLFFAPPFANAGEPARAHYVEGHWRASGAWVAGYWRDAAHPRAKRSSAERRKFMLMTGYPNGRPGYVIDHIVPLKRGGADTPANMQWQRVADANFKDGRE